MLLYKTEFPMGKVKLGTNIVSAKIWEFVSIPYGKGKASADLVTSSLRTMMYQFPMGKVKDPGDRRCVQCARKYQFPMGKVKSSRKVEIKMPTTSINSLWER